MFANHLATKPVPSVETISTSMKYLDKRYYMSLWFKEHVDHITTKARKGLTQETFNNGCYSISGVCPFCDRLCTGNPDTQPHTDGKAWVNKDRGRACYSWMHMSYILQSHEVSSRFSYHWGNEMFSWEYDPGQKWIFTPPTSKWLCQFKRYARW